MLFSVLSLLTLLSFAQTPVSESLVLKKESLPVLTLKQALGTAFEKSPDYLTSKNQLEAATLEQKNTFAGFLPSLDLTASHGFRGLDPDSAGLTRATNLVSGASLTLTENLYDNGESYKKYRISNLRLELARLNFQKTKAQIVRTVALAYYRYNITLQNLKFTQKNHQELERLSKLVTNQFQAGMKTRKDFLSFKTRAQRGQLDVYQAEVNHATATSQLLLVLGLGPGEAYRFDESLKPILSREPLSVDFDGTPLYEQRTLDLQRQISEIEVDLARRRWWPELNLVAGASYGSSEYLNTGRSFGDNDISQWSVLLNLKFNILDWGVRNRNIQITQVNQNTFQQSLRSSVFLAEKDFEIFKTELARSKETYRLAKELQKMEEDTFRLLESDYRSGRASYLELTTGLANLLDAQSRGQEADYRQADLYLRAKYYKGTLDEKTVFE